MEPHSRTGMLGTTVVASLAFHTVLLVVAVIVPIFLYEALPEPGGAVKAFFVSPVQIAAPLPPPPPPPAAARVVRPVVARQPPVEPSQFVAPIAVLDQIKPDEAVDFGIEGGVPGGVEGGVPGGVVGGVVGGILPSAVATPPPTPVVRIGGAVVAPKLLKMVAPEYPYLAAHARVQGIVIVEAHVDVNGAVKSAHVLHGMLLLDEPALEAVRQWRYQPLLLNGIPTEFILTVTVSFSISSANRAR
jgi:protein TonB